METMVISFDLAMGKYLNMCPPHSGFDDSCLPLIKNLYKVCMMGVQGGGLSVTPLSMYIISFEIAVTPCILSRLRWCTWCNHQLCPIHPPLPLPFKICHSVFEERSFVKIQTSGPLKISIPPKHPQEIPTATNDAGQTHKLT